MEEIINCGCDHGNKMVLACSGAADLGLLSDKVARALNLKGERKMSCLALLGANIEGPIKDMQDKDVLVIDGCSVDCGRKMAEQKLKHFTHLRLTDLGFVKGETIVDEAAITKAYAKAWAL